MEDYFKVYISIGLIIWGIYLISARVYYRKTGTPVKILYIEPEVVKEFPNFSHIYKYKVTFNINNDEKIAYSLEYKIANIFQGEVIPYTNKGILTKNGKISIDGVKSNLHFGIFFLMMGILSILEELG